MLAPGPDRTPTFDRDAFLSHASEDKESVAAPLYHSLTQAGVSVWYDEAELKVGDSLRQKIEQGLRTSRFGIVILSPAFFEKRWPQEELDGLYSLEGHRGKIILPVWHNVTEPTVSEKSPLLAGRKALLTRSGMPLVVRGLLEVLLSKPLPAPDVGPSGVQSQSAAKPVTSANANDFRSRQAEKLESLWQLLQITLGVLHEASAALQVAIDPRESRERESVEMMRSRGFTDPEVAEVLASSSRSSAFSKINDAKLVTRSYAAHREFHNAIIDARVLLPPALHQLLMAMDKVMWSALVDLRGYLETGDYDYRRKANEEVNAGLAQLQTQYVAEVQAFLAS